MGLLPGLAGAGADFAGAKQQWQEWVGKPTFPAEQPGETLIIIVPFFRPEGVVDDDEAHFIQRSIRQHLEEQGMTHVRVEIATGKQVGAKHRAATIALVELYHPSMLIWGSNTRPEISINYLNLRHPDFETADVRLQEVGRAQLAPPDAYQDFIVQDLPGTMTFLSLFAVGQSALPPMTLSATCLVAVSTRIWARMTRPWRTTLKAIALNPESPLAYISRGLLYQKLGCRDAAIEDFQQARNRER